MADMIQESTPRFNIGDQVSIKNYKGTIKSWTVHLRLNTIQGRNYTLKARYESGRPALERRFEYELEPAESPPDVELPPMQFYMEGTLTNTPQDQPQIILQPVPAPKAVVDELAAQRLSRTYYDLYIRLTSGIQSEDVKRAFFRALKDQQDRNEPPQAPSALEMLSREAREHIHLLTPDATPEAREKIAQRVRQLARIESRATENIAHVQQAVKEYNATRKAKKANVDFDSVVMSEEKRDQILQAIEQINQHSLIFVDWGFEETIEKGRGVSMLFYGPPGTGKTLVAQAIANKLNKTLKVISTADIESSAPGESERNIRKHFDEAAEAEKNENTKGVILLFDECDSLIFTRKAAGPILAAQVNELLSQIEKFNGITLFTTNRLGMLDEAVNRRLALKLEFAMPTIEERVKIWERMIPKKAPLHEDVDFERLATVELAGGYIKNAVLRAARIAAAVKLDDAEKKITMEHFVTALRQEAESVMDFEEAAKQGNYVAVSGKQHNSKQTIRGL